MFLFKYRGAEVVRIIGMNSKAHPETTQLETVHALLIQVFRETICLGSFDHTAVPLVVSVCLSSQPEPCLSGLQSFVVDVVSLVDTEIESNLPLQLGDVRTSSARTHLADIVKDMLVTKLIQN